MPSLPPPASCQINLIFFFNFFVQCYEQLYNTKYDWGYSNGTKRRRKLICINFCGVVVILIDTEDDCQSLL